MKREKGAKAQLARKACLAQARLAKQEIRTSLAGPIVHATNKTITAGQQVLHCR